VTDDDETDLPDPFAVDELGNGDAGRQIAGLLDQSRSDL